MISKTMNHRTEKIFKSRFITHPPLKQSSSFSTAASSSGASSSSPLSSSAEDVTEIECSVAKIAKKSDHLVRISKPFIHMDPVAKFHKTFFSMTQNADFEPHLHNRFSPEWNLAPHSIATASDFRIYFFKYFCWGTTCSTIRFHSDSATQIK